MNSGSKNSQTQAQTQTQTKTTTLTGHKVLEIAKKRGAEVSVDDFGDGLITTKNGAMSVPDSNKPLDPHMKHRVVSWWRVLFGLFVFTVLGAHFLLGLI